MEQQKERCRINFKFTSKGAVQPDITAEAENPQRADQIMREALTRAAAICADRGITMVTD